MTQTIQTVLASMTAFAAIAQKPETPVSLLVGDKFTVAVAGGEAEDVLTVLFVRKKSAVAKSELTGEKVMLPVELTSEGLELDGKVLTLHKAPVAEGEEAAPARKTRRRKSPVEGKTKQDLCREIFAANLDMPKPEVCKLFQSEANCTRMGANTYYLKIAKEVAAGVTQSAAAVAAAGETAQAETADVEVETAAA